MSIYDQTYGELLTAKETCAATGFTMNQLRNWRLPSRLDKAPFGYVSVGTSPYYRKASVQLWLDQNAGTNIKYVPAGTDKDVPLGIATEHDFDKREHLAMLATITTKNYFFKWHQKLSDDYKSEWWTYVMENQKRFYALHAGIEDPSTLTHLVRKQLAQNPEQYFIGGVMSARAFYVAKQGWNISEDEILTIPVGELPPTLETK